MGWEFSGVVVIGLVFFALQLVGAHRAGEDLKVINKRFRYEREMREQSEEISEKSAKNPLPPAPPKPDSLKEKREYHCDNKGEA